MTLNYAGSRSSKVNDNGANRKPIGSFLSDLHWVQRRISHRIRDIWCQRSCDLELGRFKVIQGQRSWCPSIAHGWFPIRLPLTPSSYLSPFSKYLTCSFNDLELGRFKVIQGQRSWSHTWAVSYLTSFESNIVSLTIFEIYFSIGAMVRIIPLPV